MRTPNARRKCNSTACAAAAAAAAAAAVGGGSGGGGGGIESGGGVIDTALSAAAAYFEVSIALLFTGNPANIPSAQVAFEDGLELLQFAASETRLRS